MFILLGASDDPCVLAVAEALARRSCEALILAHPFTGEACSSWRLDHRSSHATLAISGRTIAIDGVLAARRPPARLAPSGAWSQADLLYNTAEAEAALLGWVWGLPCKVIDRWPAWLWYRTRRPVLAFARLLAQSGLPPLDSVITADAQALTQFMDRQGGGAIDPVTGGGRQLVQASEAADISARAQLAPVRLTELHEGAWRGCLAGTRLVWDDGTPAEADRLSPRLRAFAARAGLSFLEFVVTSEAAPRVVDVEAGARFELFGPDAQRAIADGLSEALAQSIRSEAAAS